MICFKLFNKNVYDDNWKVNGKDKINCIFQRKVKKVNIDDIVKISNRDEIILAEVIFIKGGNILGHIINQLKNKIYNFDDIIIFSKNNIYDVI